MNTYASSEDASGLRFAIVVSRFNQLISEKLLDACSAELIRCGARREDIDVAWVPGAFEIPIAARAAQAACSSTVSARSDVPRLRSCSV